MANIGIIISEFNSGITKKMLKAALMQAKADGVNIVCVIWVPGCLEIPFALKKLLKKKEIQAVATLGAVLQGQTEHDRLVAFTCAEKIVSLSLQFEKPVSIGIIGPSASKKQAIARAKKYGKKSITTLKKLILNLKNIN